MHHDDWFRFLVLLAKISGNSSAPDTSVFDWWSRIIIPSAAAAASLGVAVAALLVARQSFSFAKDSRDRDEAERHRSERSRLGEMARSRALAAYAKSGGLSMPGGIDSAILGFELREQMSSSAEDFAEDLHGEFEAINKRFLPTGTPNADQVGAVVMSSAMASVRSWIQDPEHWRAETETRRAAALIATNSARAEYGLPPLAKGD